MENSLLIETDQAHEAGKGNVVLSETGRIDAFRHVEFFGPKRFFDFITVEEEGPQEPTQGSGDDWGAHDSSAERDPGNADESQARRDGRKHPGTKPQQFQSKHRTKGDRLRGGTKEAPEDNFYERVMTNMEEAGQTQIVDFLQALKAKEEAKAREEAKA